MAVAIAFGSQGSAATTGVTTVTIASLSFGSEAADRIVVAHVTFQINRTISSLTIGGVAASSLTAAISTASEPDTFSQFWYAEVPTGTTGDVVVTLSSNTTTNRVSVATYAVTGADTTPTDSDNAAASAADIAITALTIPSGGAGIAGVCHETSTSAITWTGATEDHDTNVNSEFRHSSAIITTEGTNTITADGTTASHALVGVAWGPAAGGGTKAPPVFSRPPIFMRRKAA